MLTVLQAPRLIAPLSVAHTPRPPRPVTRASRGPCVPCMPTPTSAWSPGRRDTASTSLTAPHECDRCSADARSVPEDEPTSISFLNSRLFLNQPLNCTERPFPAYLGPLARPLSPVFLLV